VNSPYGDHKLSDEKKPGCFYFGKFAQDKQVIDETKHLVLKQLILTFLPTKVFSD
jgi:hypothetical protein